VFIKLFDVLLNLSLVLNDHHVLKVKVLCVLCEVVRAIQQELVVYYCDFIVVESMKIFGFLQDFNVRFIPQFFWKVRDTTGIIDDFDFRAFNASIDQFLCNFLASHLKHSNSDDYMGLIQD
jgi:hypothetical protein